MQDKFKLNLTIQKYLENFILDLCKEMVLFFGIPRIIFLNIFISKIIIFSVVKHFFYIFEQVPELAGSWLLTILIQFPLIILLLFNEDAVLLPLERAVHIVMAVFVFFEVICGYFAIRFMVNYQVTKFHLKQFSDLEHLPDDEYWHDKYESYT